jgi:short-subunit dehydrogenase
MSSLSANFKQRYGPWVVVTGATSGLGLAIAEQLAAAGLHLVLVARRETELRTLAARLGSSHGIETRVVVADLGQATGLAALETGTLPLDVGLLVAAAGFGTSGPFLDADLADELLLLDVNCRAVLAQCHHFARRLAKRGCGGIILFGSLVGYQGAPCAAHYAASKAYVQSLAEALHVELAPQGVDVLASAPGPVATGFAARARMTMGQADRPETVARATLAALGRKMTVTPGPLSKLLTWSLMTAPRRLRVRIMAGIMSGMTKSPPASAPRA